jgi:predicted Co/Zn/Cd cation transporter (cation efflux family)
MAALGFGFWYLTESSAIMLDGFFSLIGFAMGLLTIRVARLVRQTDDQHFQFGYAAFEPMLNAVKGLIILAVCVFAGATAIYAIFDGGRDINAGWGIVYAGIATGGCLLIALSQRHVARKTGSQLVEVDSKSWLVDGLMSVVVAAAFVMAMLLEGTPWAAAAPYVDPGLVVVLAALMVGMPVRIILRGAGELLKVAPELPVQEAVRARVEGVLDAAGLEHRVIRMVRIGREFWVLNHVLVPEGSDRRGVSDFDEIRQLLIDAVRDVEPGMVVDTVFTARKDWLE